MRYHLIVSIMFSYSPWEVDSDPRMCPAGWTYDVDGDHCIHIPPEELKVSWGMAVEYCNTLGNNVTTENHGVVSVFNDETLQFILAGLLEKGHRGHQFWTGLNDLDRDGTWRWQSTGKPSPVQASSGERKYCGLYNGTRLTMVTCTDHLANPVCELTDVNPCETDNGGCQQFCYNTGFRKRTCYCRPGYEVKRETDCAAIYSCDVDNGGCDHDCRVRSAGYRFCTCRCGYRLVDYMKCEDIDECANNNGGCEHNCTNTPGSWKCSCNPGHSTDGMFCRLQNSHRRAESNPHMTEIMPTNAIVLSGALTVMVSIVGTLCVMMQLSGLKRSQGHHDLTQASIFGMVHSEQQLLSPKGGDYGGLPQGDSSTREKPTDNGENGGPNIQPAAPSTSRRLV